MTEYLVETLELLRRSRENLLLTYTEKNSDRYHYSFQYHDRPAALSIASSLLDHQWIDRQVEQSIEMFNNSEISENTLKLYLKVIKKLSIFKSEEIFEGYESLLKTKISILQSFLKSNDKMEKKIKAIEFDYYRDKILFEREMKKYCQEYDI